MALIYIIKAHIGRVSNRAACSR